MANGNQHQRNCQHQRRMKMYLMNGNGSIKPVYKNYNEIPTMTIEQAKYFHAWEIPCRCGCGLCTCRTKLIYIANTARTLAGIPFPVTSWNRCPTHNTNIGGMECSSHVTGYAMDIGISNSFDRMVIVAALIAAGAPRIKLRPDHIHFDIDPIKVWGVLML